MTTASRIKYDLDHSADKICVADLPSLLDRYSPAIKVLSLDCFDTLLWRKTAAPTDVFFDLQQQPSFKSLGLTASLRIHAEARARELMLLKHQKSEIKLRDIYLAHHPILNDDQLQTLAEEELATEMQTCFALPQTLDLIRAAHHKGLKIIIVSNTYFNEQQLRSLLTAILPIDVMSYITNIYCSCDYEKSKEHGLFSQVLSSLKSVPESILHVGDNASADYAAPKALNINAMHLLRDHAYIANLLRLQAIAAASMNPETRSTQPLFQPFQAVFSSAKLSESSPETLIGYASLGQVMYTFARFIHDEIATSNQPKILFLMRDAYLPFLACEAYTGETIGHRVNISRFSAYAASFQTTENIDNYLVEVLESRRFREITQQLLLPDKVAEPIIKAVEKSQAPIPDFLRLIRRSDIQRIIFTKSADYRKRLLRHLEKTAGIKKGDTIMLVDLGYHGTVQRLLSSFFAENEIKVIGRYLISLHTSDHESNCSGLLDKNYCDNRALNTLVSYIALLEQLCTSNENSVIDYDKEGNAIYSDLKKSSIQQQQLSLIQSECLRFIRDAKQFYQNTSAKFPLNMLSKSVLAELTRMIFFPTDIELNYFQTLQFDFNLGTKDVMKMLDTEQGLKGLHRRGIFFIEKHSKNMRMNYPAELRSAGFELTLALLMQKRLGLDIKLQDMLPRQDFLPATLMRGHERHAFTLEAHATYDGYYSAWTPVGAGDIQVAVAFGKNYEWVQIESAELIKMDAFIAQQEAENTVNAWECLSFDKMTEKSGNLFECLSASSAVVMSPNVKLEPAQYVLRLVYRPIARRVVKEESGPRISFTF